MNEAAKQAMSLEPGSLFAGYRIEGLLDRGGMGVVYRAADPELDRVVALKIIAPEHTRNEDAVARFKAEARLAASLEHPNIVPIHRGGEFEGVLYLAMRFVPGTNLRQLIDGGGPLELDRVRRVTASVAAALDAAHERGLVHRDVKPANILIGGEGGREQVYLTDFGLTKRLGSQSSLTRTGAWVGTPDYVAPEQIRAEAVDGRADVYSLGCVLYEMLTGSVAFPKDNDVAKLWAHVTDPPPAPSLKRPELAKAFDAIVARATAKDPAGRYPTASELAAAVDRAAAEQRSRPELEGLQATRAPADRHDVFVAEPTQPPADAPAGLSGERTPPPPPDTVAPPPQPPTDPPQPLADGSESGRPGGTGRSVRRRWPVVAGLALLLGGIAAAVVLISDSSESGSPQEALGDRVPATLGPVPTNRVDGQGTVTVRLNGTLATVTLKTNGLLDRSPHVMHIHAGGKGICPPVQAAREQNGHLSISTLGGAPFYGKPRVSLTTSGDIGVASILEFARYPKAGAITYRRTLRLRPRTVSLIRRNLAGIVVHGIDYNGNGRYDETLGGSDLNPSLTAEATAPALCGELAAPRQQTAGKPHPNGSNVYRAALNLPQGDPWLCDLRFRA
jgi:serine/threonine protein kinase